MTMVNLHKAIETVLAGSAIEAAQMGFWYGGELGEKAKATGINSTVLARCNRACEWMGKNTMPVYRPWMLQLCLWHRSKGGPVKVPVLAFKYTLLDEARRNGMEWTRALDDHTEALAIEAIRAHKG